MSVHGPLFSEQMLHLLVHASSLMQMYMMDLHASKHKCRQAVESAALLQVHSILKCQMR